ncbi:HAD-IIIA family hydrolase [Virgibacillus senegalensis]|uniref:HAD-IIIA family hydrolase n=1 Tax=Virgibacillus senegalensis TaxID=1499679 RepID=UPI00069F1976|nr:HAD-IIIA family hydrolase [Virgibacillus senegalensis]
MNKIDAVFIDRDGTIGGDDTVHYPGTFELYPFSLKTIRRLTNDGVNVFSFTNQPGISRGEATIQEFTEELQRFGFTDVYICPHGPDDKCPCRKPEPGMLLQAADDYGLNLNKTVVIGDRWSDMAAADEVHAIKIMVETGAGIATLEEKPSKLEKMKIDYIAKNLEDAVEWLSHT